MSTGIFMAWCVIKRKNVITGECGLDLYVMGSWYCQLWAAMNSEFLGILAQIFLISNAIISFSRRSMHDWF